MKKWIYPGIILIPLIITGIFLFKKAPTSNFFFQPEIGQKIDSLNGVYVYHNGSTANVSGRNLAANGYNIGLKYQCVEFVKRYYFEHFDHQMPNSYGHAKDFFNSSLIDGQINPDRNLIQYKNNGKEKPRVNDILVFKGTNVNKFGHIAIVAAIHGNEIEIIQQNAGSISTSREFIKIEREPNKWILKNKGVLGWLRKK